MTTHPMTQVPEVKVDPVQTHVASLPNKVLYFDRLDTSSLRRPTSEQCTYLFERSLPRPLEDVHSSFVHVDSTTTIACGIDRELLETLLRDGHVPPQATVLIPASLPASLDIDARVLGPTKSQLNLLHGDYLPSAVQGTTRRLWIQSFAAMLIVALVLGLGMERRVQHHRAQVASLELSRDSIYDDVLPPAAAAATSNAQRHARFVSELRLLRQTRSDGAESTAGTSSVSDVDHVLAQLVNSWPPNLEMQTESISITGTAVTVIAQVASMPEAESFANGFDATRMFAWDMQQPQTRAIGDDRVRVTLRFKPRVVEVAEAGQ